MECESNSGLEITTPELKDFDFESKGAALKAFHKALLKAARAERKKKGKTCKGGGCEDGMRCVTYINSEQLADIDKLVVYVYSDDDDDDDIAYGYKYPGGFEVNTGCKCIPKKAKKK